MMVPYKYEGLNKKFEGEVRRKKGETETDYLRRIKEDKRSHLEVFEECPDNPLIDD